jgi:hypothetical protein
MEWNVEDNGRGRAPPESKAGRSGRLGTGAQSWSRGTKQSERVGRVDSTLESSDWAGAVVCDGQKT